MKSVKIFKTFLAGFILMTMQQVALAQRDTTKTQSVDITSSYKPVLRNAVKINFSGTQLTADTSINISPYRIPSQNLYYAYEPVSLRPLALEQDTSLDLGLRRYIKAGFGSYTTPYVKAAWSIGDGKKSLVNISGDYIGSQGDIEFQDYYRMHLGAAGSYFSAKNEFYGSVDYAKDQYYLYGYDHAAISYTKDELSQQFQDISLHLGLRNTSPVGAGINYNPDVTVNFFTNIDRVSEGTVAFNLPVEKKIGDALKVMLAAKGSITNYNTKRFIPNNYNLTNNLVQLAPAVEYEVPRLRLHAGLTPSWNNGVFEWVPEIYAEGQLQEKVFLLQAGWVGSYTPATYRYLSRLNPYLAPVTGMYNTKQTEFYGGIKASIAKHFNFGAKVSLISYKDLPLFVNAPGDEKSFFISKESSINNFRIHGNLSYISGEKFNITGGLTLNGYTGMQDNAKAWHTIPMEFTSSLRWQPVEKLLIKGDILLLNGGNYRTATGGALALTGATDLSGGAEYKINNQFSIWLNANNILNDKYERWHNYPVYGLNVLGGIIIRF
ncbi:MAG: hypothetical protein ABIT96_03780 [Ferruginibacter sp.]